MPKRKKVSSLPPRNDLKGRLFACREIIDDHWIWTGAVANEYPVMKVHGATISVCRLSLEIFKGIKFKADQQANHIIECTYKICFNPDHLYAGTHKDNMKDRSIVHPPKSRMQKNREYYARHNQHRKNCGRLF